MESLALTIDLVLLGIFTIGVVMLSIGQAKHEKQEKEAYKRAA